MLKTLALAVTGGGVLLAACGGGSNPFRSSPPPAGVPGESRVPYGRQGEEDVTGAISAVPMDRNESYQTVVEMLRSHVPGLQVTETPDGSVTLRIRGAQQSLLTDDASNQPLLVIDDLPVIPAQVGIALRSIIPHQVESIHVLKDLATTAIYGSRGANGVILIYLKR